MTCIVDNKIANGATSYMVTDSDKAFLTS